MGFFIHFQLNHVRTDVCSHVAGSGGHGPLVAHMLVSADATALLPRFASGMETETAQAD
jgi:hypothetical protein